MRKNTHILYGCATAIVMIGSGSALMYGIYVKDMFSKGIGLLVYLPFLLGIIWNAIAFSKANDGYVTFGNVFESCFKAVLVVMVARIAWIPVSDWLFPEARELQFFRVHTRLMNNPRLTDRQVERAYSLLTMGWYPILIASAIFNTLLNGAIFSLLASAIAEKNGPRPLEINNS